MGLKLKLVKDGITMKQFREDGARLFTLHNPNPNGPDVQMWIKHHQSCMFCENCETGLDCSNPKSVKVLARCKLPSVSEKGNCLLHCLNRNGSCCSFKDIDGDKEGVVMIKKKKPVEEPQAPIATFSISKDGVEEKK